MKLSSTTVKELRSEWTGVVRQRERMKFAIMGIFAGGSPGSGISARAAFKVKDIVYNLPLLLAFDVLKQALDAARKEKLFACPGTTLGKLMWCGRDALTWIDWDALKKGVEHRNEVAHDGKIFGEEEYLQEIEVVPENRTVG